MINPFLLSGIYMSAKKTILSKSWLRRNIMSLSENEFEKFKSVVEEVSQDKLNAIEEERREHQEKLKKVAQLKAAANELNISLEEVLELEKPNLAGKTKSKQPKAPPKYRLNLPDGNVVEWTGNGRYPKPFKEIVERGESLDNYLIKQEG